MNFRASFTYRFTLSHSFCVFCAFFRPISLLKSVSYFSSFMKDANFRMRATSESYQLSLVEKHKKMFSMPGKPVIEQVSGK